jgi:hypothetical protein
MLELLYRRLFEITEITIDNFDTILLPYIQKLPEFALFDNTTFTKIGIKILNNNQPITEEIKHRVNILFNTGDKFLITQT